MPLLSNTISTGETSLSSLESHVSQLEQAPYSGLTLLSKVTQVTLLQLHMEELEDWSCRNNLRLRGIPEAAGQESLQPTVLAICQQLATSITPQDLEFDRVH